MCPATKSERRWLVSADSTDDTSKGNAASWSASMPAVINESEYPYSYICVMILTVEKLLRAGRILASVSCSRKAQQRTFDKVTYFSNLIEQGIVNCNSYTLALIFVRHTSGIYGAVGPISRAFKGRNLLTNFVAIILRQIWY